MTVRLRCGLHDTWFKLLLLSIVLMISQSRRRVTIHVPLVKSIEPCGLRCSIKCRKLLTMIFLGNESQTAVDGIIVVRYGGFGNNFHQMLNAVLYGQILQGAVVCVPKGFLFLNRSFVTTKGIHVLVGGSEQVMHPITLYGFSGRNSGCFQHDKFSLAATFKFIVVEHFPLSLANKTILYEHVRSGDIFMGVQPAARGSYAQPPCSFYTDAAKIDGRERSNVMLMAWDRLNPCVEVLVAAGFRYQERELFFDLGAMLRATRFVMARGSIGHAVIYLSLIKKIFYTFGYVGWPGLGPHMNCDPPSHYFEGLKTVAWKDVMLESRCAAWRHVNN